MNVLKEIKVGEYTHLGKSRKGQLYIGHRDTKGVLVWVRVRDASISMSKPLRGVLYSLVKGLGRV